jgi:aminoglycoside phosphotransferase family enzyme
MEAAVVKELARGMGAEIRETHISWVLLAGQHAYKIKRPVKFSFLDFTTLEQREFFCNEEVRLNRRLAPEVYLGVVPVLEEGGKLLFGDERGTLNAGAGRKGHAAVSRKPAAGGGAQAAGGAIDYAVKMKRLDEAHMMDRLLDEGKVAEGSIRNLAAVIADFHGRIESAPGYNSPETIGVQISDLINFRSAIEEACGMGGAVDSVVGRCDRFIDRNDAFLRERMKDGRVKDCHGDLHSGNVFLPGGKAVIIDCIEFSRDFRCVDVASEIAFMAMDLDAHGKEDYAALFVKEYVSRTGDSGLLRLLDFYRCYRANVRAKIAAIEWSLRKEDRERKKIIRYMTLAERYAKTL